MNATAKDELVETVAKDKVWCSIERRISLGVETYEHVDIHVGSVATVEEGSTRKEMLGVIEGELLKNIEVMIPLLREEIEADAL